MLKSRIFTSFWQLKNWCETHENYKDVDKTLRASFLINTKIKKAFKIKPIIHKIEKYKFLDIELEEIDYEWNR